MCLSRADINVHNSLQLKSQSLVPQTVKGAGCFRLKQISDLKSQSAHRGILLDNQKDANIYEQGWRWHNLTLSGSLSGGIAKAHKSAADLHEQTNRRWTQNTAVSTCMLAAAPGTNLHRKRKEGTTLLILATLLLASGQLQLLTMWRGSQSGSGWKTWEMLRFVQENVIFNILSAWKMFTTCWFFSSSEYGLLFKLKSFLLM